MPEKIETLYDRIGGQLAIRELLHDFYDSVLADPELEPFFRKTSMEKLRRMQQEFFSTALDGPITYTGRPLSQVHHGRGITKHHFALFIGHLLNTIERRGINEQDVQYIIGRISTYANEITGEVGSTG